MKRNLLFLLFIFLMFVGFICADWYPNPNTGTIDYYEPGLPTGVVGDVVYHNGTAWVVLHRGANTNVLTLAAGVPSWVAAGAPGAHAASHELLGADLIDHDNLTNFVAGEHLLVGAIDHDSLLNYVAGQHLVLPNTIANVLSDWDADLDTYAGITPSVNVQTLLGNATFAAFMADLSGTATAAFSFNSQGLDGIASIDGPAAAMDINSAIIQNVNFWDTIASGNPSINIYGWNTAGGDRESVELTMDDTNDEFLIQVPNSANNEGVTISLLETNQRLRIRQNADIGSIYMDGTDMQFHTTDGTFVFDSDEAAAVAAIVLYDDDTNYVTIQSQEMAGNWVFTFPAADGAANDVLYDSDGSGTMAYATATSLVTAATTGAAGKVELATTAETSGGTDTARAITADGLAGSTIGRKTMILKVMAEDTVVTSGDGKMYFTVPVDLNGWDLTAVGAHVYTADTGADHIHIDIYNLTDTADMLSAAMQIEDGEKDTATSATPGTINGATDDVATADEIRIDVTTYAGSSAKGLEIRLTFEKQV